MKKTINAWAMLWSLDDVGLSVSRAAFYDSYNKRWNGLFGSHDVCEIELSKRFIDNLRKLGAEEKPVKVKITFEVE